MATRRVREIIHRLEKMPAEKQVAIANDFCWENGISKIYPMAELNNYLKDRTPLDIIDAVTVANKFSTNHIYFWNNVFDELVSFDQPFVDYAFDTEEVAEWLENEDSVHAGEWRNSSFFKDMYKDWDAI